MALTEIGDVVMTRNFSGGTVSRILMVSPEQNEMVRRNRSRIYITNARESVIDSVLFQGYRPIDDFVPSALRAITMAGLTDISGDLTLTAAFEHGASAGFMQQHLVSRGWLQDGDKNVVDLILEVELQTEMLPDINMKTFDAPYTIDGSNENPLVIFCGIEDLYPQLDDDNIDQGQQEVAEQPQTEALSDNNGSGSGRGRVKDPENDGRMKHNRDNAMARQADQGSTAGVTASTAAQGSTARMAGKPGRVARPWDGRLKHNRGGQSAGAGGR